MEYTARDLPVTSNVSVKISLPQALHWQSHQIVSFPIRDDYGLSQALKYRGFFKGKRDEFIVNIYAYETEQVLRPIDRLIMFNSFQSYGYVDSLYEGIDTACAKFKKLNFADTGNEKTSTVFYDGCNVIVVDIATDIEKSSDYADVHEKIRTSLKFISATPYSCTLKSDTDLSNVEALPDTTPFTFILPFNWSYEREGRGNFALSRFTQRSINPSTPDKLFGVIEVGVVYKNVESNAYNIEKLKEGFEKKYLIRWKLNNLINQYTEINTTNYSKVGGKQFHGHHISYDGGAPNNLPMIAMQTYIRLPQFQLIVSSVSVKYERENQTIEDYDRLDTFAIAAQGRLIQDIILRQLIQIYDNKKEN